MKPKFYGLNITVPLSTYNNTDAWANSPQGRLYAVNPLVSIAELQPHERRADYAWRVVDAYFTDEDSTITYFRAYGLDGERLPQATFGVNYSTVPSRISGGFAYPPPEGNAYYVPVQNNFSTPETGGYTVRVLDLNHPSEGMRFGMNKSGDQHQCLVISFRLLPLGQGYPNDTDWQDVSHVEATL